MPTFKKILPFLIIFILVLLLYYPALFTYFSHDDFFHFKVSLTNGKLGEFINFFGFHPFAERNIAFYRPLFREVLYHSFYNLFGLNPLPFRILAFILHYINIYLVFALMRKLFKNNLIAFFTSFFFAISAANVAPLYYLAGGIQTQGATLFILMTLILFINYLNTKNVKYQKLSFITFLIALASHEQSVVLPILLSGLVFIKFDIRTSIKKIIRLWPYFAVVAVYIYLNVAVIGYSSAETQYKMILNLKTTIQTIAWYIVWSLGIPEMLQDFLEPGLRLNPNLMRYWGVYYRIIFLSFFITLIIYIFVIFYIFLKNRKSILDKRLLLLIFWFPLGILPVIFLPQHKSTHYLYPSLPAFWGVSAYLVNQVYIKIVKYNAGLAKFILGVLTISLVVLSSTSALLEKTTYWASARGKVAEKLINDVRHLYPSLPRGSVIYFTNDPAYPFISEGWGGTSKQASFALNGEDGLQILYQDPTLRVFYEDSGEPTGFSSEKIYSLVVRL